LKKRNGGSLALENPNSKGFSARMPLDKVEVAIIDNRYDITTNSIVLTIIKIVTAITNIVTEK
jgi:hypothetical protein